MFGAHALTTLPWAVGISAVALFLAWRAYRNDRYALAVRRVGWATLTWAVWLVGLMRLAVDITGSVVDWATGFVFRPSVWIGLVVGVVGVLLVVGASAARRRRPDPAADGAPKETPGPSRKRVGRATTRPATVAGAGGEGGDADNMDDIEAILRKHGIE